MVEETTSNPTPTDPSGRGARSSLTTVPQQRVGVTHHSYCKCSRGLDLGIMSTWPYTQNSTQALYGLHFCESPTHSGWARVAQTLPAPAYKHSFDGILHPAHQIGMQLDWINTTGCVSQPGSSVEQVMHSWMSSIVFVYAFFVCR